jgi:hypothetical protein
MMSFSKWNILFLAAAVSITLLWVSISRTHTASAQTEGIANKPQDTSAHEKAATCIERDAKGNKIRDLPSSTSGCGIPIPQVAESLQSAAPGVAPFVAVAASQNLTLTRSRDYRYAGGNIGCPNCKDMFCATFAPPVITATITSTTFLRSRNSGHWYRCQVQHMCGRPEFSDPANPRQDCIGKASCNICRATDDGREAEDDITFTFQ